MGENLPFSRISGQISQENCKFIDIGLPSTNSIWALYANTFTPTFFACSNKAAYCGSICFATEKRWIPVCKIAKNMTACCPDSAMAASSRKCFCPRSVLASGNIPKPFSVSKVVDFTSTKQSGRLSAFSRKSMRLFSVPYFCSGKMVW
ncbi:hypothetical protein ACEE_10430 [Actinobacillus equuli subsp. equuli]|nr:hypothetical protein ACEE_10430 [Actinobacillus equuli subsp. equuli]